MAILNLPMAIIGAYLMVFVVIGAYEARNGIVKDPSDYFLAGRGLGVVVLLWTMFASILSGWAYFGGPGFASVGGLGFLTLGFANLASVLFMFIIGLKVWKWSRNLDIISPPEMFAKRLDSKIAGTIMLISMTAYLIPYIAIQPMAGGIIFEVVSNGSITDMQGVAITIIIMTLYVIVAGMRGVAWTDTIQGVLMVIFLFIVMVFLAVTQFNGFAGAGSAMVENAVLFTSPGPTNAWNPYMAFSWIVLIIGLNSALPYVLVRFMAANSARTVKRTAFFFGIAVILFYFAIAFVGTLGSVAYPGVETPDNIFVAIVLDIFPLSVAAIFLGGALSAMISTADSQMLVLSQMLTRDGYREHINPDASRRRETLIGQVIIIILAILGGLIAFYEPQFIFEFGAFLFTGIGVMAPSMLAIALWKRVTAPGVVMSVVVGESMVLGIILGLIPEGYAAPFHYSTPVFIVVIAVLVAVSLLTEPPSDETIEDFF